MPLIVAPAPSTTGSSPTPVAGVPFTIDYSPKVNGQAFDPADQGGSVGRIRLYTTEARTGTPVVDITGATRIGFGQYRFTLPALGAGTYYAVVTYTPASGAGLVTDINDTIIVYPFDGSLGDAGTLVTLAEVKVYLGKADTKHDDELSRLIRSSTGAVEEMSGPTLIRRTFTERVSGRGQQLLLNHYPVVTVLSVGDATTGTVSPYTGDASAYAILDASIGSVRTPYNGTTEVTYTAGLATVPDEAKDAALVWISYKYRRNHGGSETYMPAGSDGNVLPPMGTTALTQQIRLALGQYARGPHIA